MDFKEDLKSQFQKSGLLDNLKVQMRYKLLEKLQKNKAPSDERPYEENTHLEYKVIVSMIDDFLD